MSVHSSSDLRPPRLSAKARVGNKRLEAPGARRGVKGGKPRRRSNCSTEKNRLVDLRLARVAGILNLTTKARVRTSVEISPEKWSSFCDARKTTENSGKVPRTPPKRGLVRESICFFYTWLSRLYGGGKDWLPTMSEDKKRGRPVSAQKLSRSKKAMSVPDSEIQKLWDYWVDKMRAGSKRKPVLDSNRRQYLGAAIHDYGMQGCIDAIDGCALSEFHMGRNKMNKRYDSVELIFRDAEHVEKFQEIFDKSNEEADAW